VTDEQKSESSGKKFDALVSGVGKLLREKPIEFAGVLVALATLLVAAISVVYLGDQLKGLNATLESQSYSYITNGLSEYDKLLVEKAAIMPYLEGDAAGGELPLPERDPDTTAEIMALANYKLDFIDSFYSQHAHINWERHTRCGWEVYFRDSFERSQALCTLLCRNPDQYGNHVRHLGVAVCQRKASASASGCTGLSSMSLPAETAQCIENAQ